VRGGLAVEGGVAAQRGLDLGVRGAEAGLRGGERGGEDAEHRRLGGADERVHLVQLGAEALGLGLQVGEARGEARPRRPRLAQALFECREKVFVGHKVSFQLPVISCQLLSFTEN
jgi:hypothetical protein